MSKLISVEHYISYYFFNRGLLDIPIYMLENATNTQMEIIMVESFGYVSSTYTFRFEKL